MLQKYANDAILAKQEAKKTYKGSGKWSPSSFGSCYRKQWWNRAKEEPSDPLSLLTLRKFACGNIFEDFVIRHIPDELQRQVLVETEDIKGFADVVTDNAVIDIKSISSKAFWWMNKSNYDIKKDKYGYILQVMTYAYFLNKEKGVLTFVSKDDLCIEEYEFHINAWEQDVLSEINHLKSLKELPEGRARAMGGEENKLKTGDKKYIGQPMECKYCQWFSKCRLGNVKS